MQSVMVVVAAEVLVVVRMRVVLLVAGEPVGAGSVCSRECRK